MPPKSHSTLARPVQPSCPPDPATPRDPRATRPARRPPAPRDRASAKVSELAEHFRLASETVRRRLDKAGIKPVALGPERYLWQDVWTRLEGVAEVRPEDEAELRRPLLTSAEVQERHLPHVSVRAITDRAKRGVLPAIRLGDEWRFRERDVREAARHG